MAGIGGGTLYPDAPPSPTSRGVLSPLARAQYAALAALRWHMFVNGLRSKLGAFELGARTITFVFYGLMGLALGAGAGAAAYGLADDDQWQYFPIVFWVVCLIWQVVPVMLASFQQQFDLGGLLRFPVSFRSFFLLYVVFGLSDVSSILGGLCCLGIFVGLTVARPDLFAWTALILLVFAAFNVFLVRAVFAWIDRWLAQRKTREILAAVFMVLILSFQFFNPALHQNRHQGHGGKDQQGEAFRKLMASPWVKTANQVQKWLPPGLAAVALRESANRQQVPVLGSLAVLGLFTLGIGGALGLRLRAEYRGENLGTAPSRKTDAAPRPKTAQRESAWSLGGSGPIAAIIEKELRSLMRTLPLLYAVGAPLVMVLVFSSVFLRNPQQVSAPLVAFPLCVFFAQIGFGQLFSNNLGAEGAGIQLYFLSPTTMRTVMLGKNLFHAALFSVAIVIAGILASVRLGRPDGIVVAVTIAWLLFSLPCSLAAGNIFSLTMPYRVNPGRISRQRGSQANSLLSLVVQVGVLALGAAVFELCSFFDQLWLAIPGFLVLAAAAVFVWLRVLGNTDDIANQRRDSLIGILMKTE